MVWEEVKVKERKKENGKWGSDIEKGSVAWFF